VFSILVTAGIKTFRDLEPECEPHGVSLLSLPLGWSARQSLPGANHAALFEARDSRDSPFPTVRAGLRDDAGVSTAFVTSWDQALPLSSQAVQRRGKPRPSSQLGSTVQSLEPASERRGG